MLNARYEYNMQKGLGFASGKDAGLVLPFCKLASQHCLALARRQR